MAKLLKNITLLLIVSFFFFGCDDNNNPTEPDDSAGGISKIEGKITGWSLGTGYTVKLTSENGTKASFYSASASISADGSFKLENLKTVPADYLDVVDFPDGVTSTNTNVKLSDSYLYVFHDASGARLGEVYYENFMATPAFFADYFYADGNAEITGTTVEDGVTVTINLDIKKGWNVYYYVFTGDNQASMTSTKPGDGEWIFTGGKNTGKRFSLFKK